MMHSTTKTLDKMRQEIIFKDGAFSIKTKVLFAIFWSISIRCSPCLEFYVNKARKYEVTEEEIKEMISVASVMGGCPGEIWGLEAHKIFSKNNSKNGCCDAHEKK